MTATQILDDIGDVVILGGALWSLIAGIGHWAIGSVDFGLLFSLLIGSVPGIVIGSLIASRISERVLLPLLAATLTVVGAKLLF